MAAEHPVAPAPSASPLPLSRRQWTIVTAVAMAVAVTRLWAISRTLWDWDEALFSLALRHYDVTLHHPHPPGFPLYIALAKLVTLAGVSEFRALQTVAVLSSLFLFPAAFALARELRAGFATAVTAGLLLAFFPNVWLYGGTAFSDVASMVLVTAALALLLRGAHHPRAFYIGAIVLAVAAGFRPQNLLVGLVPLIFASRGARRFFDACAIIGVIVAASYGAAAWFSGGWPEYRDAVRGHEAYITATDSWRSPQHPPLWRSFDDFFIRPYRAAPINAAVTLLCAVSGVAAFRPRRRPFRARLLLATFVPLALLAWLYLDRFSVSRFSIGYAPLLALLAADGLAILFRSRPSLIAAGGIVLAMAMAVWSWPAIREVRDHPSPSAQAALWLDEHADRSTAVFAGARMFAIAEALLPGRRVQWIEGEAPPTLWRDGERGLFVREGAAPGARLFTRAHGRLWELVRQRYFEISVLETPHLLFGDGWYPQEGRGDGAIRWMGRQSHALLPAGPTRHLTLRLYAPLDAVDSPLVEIRVGGVVDRFRATSTTIERTILVSASQAPVELTITTGATAHPPGDSRELGLRLDGLQ
jgi:hypothetical protein